MLSELFTSKTRIRLLIKLFLNPDVSCYLRELAREFELSAPTLQDELDSLSKAGYLNKEKSGRFNLFQANTKHPFFPELNSIVKKYLGLDSIAEQVMHKLGYVHSVYILDDYARGVDSGLIDVLVIGDVDRQKMDSLRLPVESKVQRKIRVMSLTVDEFEDSRDVFLNRPHWQLV